MIDLLCYHLLKADSQPKYQDAFVKNKEQLRKIAVLNKSPEYDSEYWKVLEYICLYHTQFHSIPVSTALRDFVRNNSDLAINQSWSEALKQALNELHQMDEVRLGQCSDPNVMIQEVIKDGRKGGFEFALTRARDINLADVSVKKTGKDKVPAGTDDAKTFLIQALSKDPSRGTTEMEGVWQDNAAAVALKLDEYLNGKKNRILTGFPQIDKRFVMRIGKTLVIMGNAGDGKTLFLNSMIYNMAAKGERILYNALEFDVDETWEAFAFVHQRSLRDRINLPSKYTWMEHDPPDNPTITQEDINNMTLVLRDYQNGGVPGPIDVIRKWTMDEFMAYYEANNPLRQYSVVVIDYVSHLRLDNNFRSESEKQAAVDTMASKLVSWTHEKNKFLFITPAQVGKSAGKDAIKRFENSEDAAGDSGYTLDSLYYGSALKQDGDLVISVFSPDTLKQKEPPEMQVKCLKHRMTQSFKTITLKVDVDHEFAYDNTDPATSKPEAVVMTDPGDEESDIIDHQTTLLKPKEKQHA